MPYFTEDRTIHVPLTNLQKKALEKIEKLGRKESEEGRPGIVLAQISFDAMMISVSFVTHDEGVKILSALGIDGNNQEHWKRTF